MPAKQSKTTQKDLIMVMVMSLILGLGGGYIINDVINSDNSNDTAEFTEPTNHSHDSAMYGVDASDAPSVAITVTEDAKSGYNIMLTTDKFIFTPENVNQENIIGEGHAHLYVDGVKIGRLYGPNYHYEGEFEGTKTFKVILNANDHSEYTVNGQTVESEVQVTHNSNSADHNHN